MSPSYRMVVGIADPLQSQVVERVASGHPRFEVVATAPNAVMTVDVARQTLPDVVVLADLSPGTPGRQMLSALAEAVPRALVIMTTGGDPGELERRNEVASAVRDHDMDALTEALDSTAAFLDHPELDQPERRRHAERRVHQDWTKVFAERRVEVRRAAERLAPSA
ncbi:MAG: hypothetical protein ACRBI6_03410 [Acidimicrobiales bacterium]